jgi:hypothetical protein
VIDIADSNDFDFGSFLIAVGTSFLLLAIYEPIARRREERQQPSQPV